MRKINQVWEGLRILAGYSNNIDIEGKHVLIAGPTTMKGPDRLSHEDITVMYELGWLFEEGQGWSILI